LTRSSSEPEAPLYQTDLSQTPLPDLLVKIHRYKAPGRIECRRGEMIKRVYLDHGSIIFATTNQIAESLGDRLLNSGRITRDQYDESVRRTRETRKRHGVTLVEMKLLTPDELFTAVREQIEEIVWSIFAWDSATVTFTPGREKHLEFVKVDIAVPQAVMRGVRRMPDARALLARMGTRTTLLDRTKEEVEGLTLTADEEALVAAANGKTPLPDLVNAGPNPPADNARVLYGLFVLGLVAPKERLKIQLKSSRAGDE
jgi:uncharacterized protein DUF4388